MHQGRIEQDCKRDVRKTGMISFGIPPKDTEGIPNLKVYMYLIKWTRTHSLDLRASGREQLMPIQLNYLPLHIAY